MQEILHYPKLTPHSALVNSGRLAKALSLKRFGDLLLHRLVHQVELPAFGDVQRQKESGSTGSSCSFSISGYYLVELKESEQMELYFIYALFFCVWVHWVFLLKHKGAPLIVACELSCHAPGGILVP